MLYKKLFLSIFLHSDTCAMIISALITGSIGYALIIKLRPFTLSWKLSGKIFSAILMTSSIMLGLLSGSYVRKSILESRAPKTIHLPQETRVAFDNSIKKFKELNLQSTSSEDKIAIFQEIYKQEIAKLSSHPN